MKTDIVTIDSNGEYLQGALNRIEGLASVQGLNTKQSLYLRLLAEELFGIIRSHAGQFKGRFYAEGEGTEYKIVLEADADDISDEAKSELLSLSEDNTNANNIGIMSKISALFGAFMRAIETYNLDSNIASLEYSKLGMAASEEKHLAWSLKKYKEGVENFKEAANTDGDWESAWDELKKSVVANVADDIIVGIKDNTVKVEICKDFANEA